MHKFSPHSIERLLSEERERDLKPFDLLTKAGLKAGDVFADVGCGPGFFSFPAAGIVDKGGKVFAIDTQEEMLRFLVERNHPGNVVPVKSEENSIPLGDGSVDFALLAYVLHEAEDRKKFLGEVRRILRKGGVLFAVDWEKKVEEKGPPVEERIEREDAVRTVREAGFTGIKASSLNPSHYCIRAVR